MKTRLNCLAWSSKDLRRLDTDGVIPGNWQAQWDYAQANPAYMDFCLDLAGSSGPVLEVAAGPGGGNLSPLLHIDPSMDIVLNDIEPGITERWQLFLDRTLPGHRVTFAAFDICHIPFEDGTFACVSSSGGFGTMLGSLGAAFEECVRVLRPGGLVYAHELALTEACLAKMPEALRKALVYHPWLFRCWDSLLYDIGFSRILLRSVERRTLSPGESPLATDAAMFDAEIEVERILLVARKIEGTVMLNWEGNNMYDLLIKDVRIVDGTGAPWYRGSVSVQNGKIVAMGPTVRGEARQVVDGGDRVLAPGFVDLHSHSDFSLLTEGCAESKLLQGVTTDIGGNCGISPAPVVTERLDLLKKYVGFLNDGLSFEWRSFGGFLDEVERQKPAMNFGSIVGHGTLRIAAMGFDDRTPTNEEMDHMKVLLRQSMEQGSFGVSTGLIYPPGCYSKTDELVEIAKVAAEFGGVYETHMRDEDDNLLQSIEESGEVARRAGIAVQIAHHKVCGRKNWGKGEAAQRRIESLREEGLDVANDQYPYNATSTTITTMFPNWAHEGGVDMLLARLRDPEVRAMLRKGVMEAMERLDKRWEDTVIAGVRYDHHKKYEGLNLLEAAELAGRVDDPCGFMFDLVESEEGTFSIICYAMAEEDIKTIMASPITMIGSDGSAVPLSAAGKPHPRTFGTFARVLRKYCLEECVFTLEEAVRKMSSLPASRLGIFDRGILRPGFAADMVLFDPALLKDTATYADPQQAPKGIDKVWVNGQLAVDAGQVTGLRAGQVLRKGR